MLTSPAVRDELKDIRDALCKLLHGNVPMPESGICANVALLARTSNNIILLCTLKYYCFNLTYDRIVAASNVLQTWPHFSGQITWPVPGDGERYQDLESVWTGLNGAYRRSFCLFLLEQIRNAIGD